MRTIIKSLICIFVIVLPSCIFEGQQKDKPVTARKITVPEFDTINFLCTNDTLDYYSYNKKLKDFPFKIVIYADSVNCIDCDLNLIEWKQRIKEIEKRKLNVCFLFVLNSGYYSVIKHTVERDGFRYPIFFDRYGYFAKVNNFPGSIKFVTFLLNGEDKIILTGSPVNNANNWNLYLNKITSGKL